MLFRSVSSISFSRPSSLSMSNLLILLELGKTFQVDGSYTQEELLRNILENEAITMIYFQDFTTIFILFPLVLIQPKGFVLLFY